MYSLLLSDPYDLQSSALMNLEGKGGGATRETMNVLEINCSVKTD